MALDIGINKIAKMLSEKEKKLDIVLAENRGVVRACSNAIKAMHAYDLKTAKKHLKEADDALKALAPHAGDFPAQLNHVYQEYAEAQIVLSAIELKKIPGYAELKVPEIPYLLGLLDAVGELKREMYESLRRGNKHEAGFYFKMMEEIYDELLPLRFSNAVLPEFRKKQDSARHQIEQARGELL
jgi:translin